MIYKELYYWQKSLIDEILDKHKFGLWLDMGTGKTPISLALAEQHECTKAIVITINSKVYETNETEGSWLYWADKSNIRYEYSIKKDTHFGPKQPDLFLINYEALFNRKGKGLSEPVNEFIKSCKGHKCCIIVDESHKMKDLASRQTKAVKQIKLELTKQAKELYCYLLTGTPFTTGYIDLYSQLKFLGYPESKTTFVDDFCVRGNIPGLLGWQQPIVGYKNIDKLFDLVHQYAVTIESKSVSDLPEQIFIKHSTPITEDFKMFIYEKITSSILHNYQTKREGSSSILNIEKKVNNPYFRDIGYNSITKTSPWLAETAGTFWLRARQLSIGFNGNAENFQWFNQSRLKAIKKFLEENEDNYLLFYNYTPELLALYDICEELGYKIDVYCGEVKSLTNYEVYSKQTEAQRLTNTKNIILANFASGSTGLNWQLYNKCIITSLPVYKDWAQGIKRIHRTGQKKTTFYHIFYQDNWLDNSMYKALTESIDYSEKMFMSDLARITEMISGDTKSG